MCFFFFLPHYEVHFEIQECVGKVSIKKKSRKRRRKDAPKNGGHIKCRFEVKRKPPELSRIRRNYQTYDTRLSDRELDEGRSACWPLEGVKHISTMRVQVAKWAFCQLALISAMVNDRSSAYQMSRRVVRRARKCLHEPAALSA